MTPSLHALTQVLALRMVESLAWGTVIVLFAAALLRVTRQNARTRFAVWFSTLLAIGLVPCLAGWRSSGLISASSVGRAAVIVPDQWALYVCAAWAVIAAWFAVGIGRAVRHLHVLRRNSVDLDPTLLDSILTETLRKYSTERGVSIRISNDVRVPTAIGLLKPAILLPNWVINELTPAEVNQILLHELAHLRRFDDWTNLLQQMIKAVFFFHPAVWWIERQVAVEREMACDDAVLAETASPRAYAECLARVAEKSFLHRTVTLAQAVLGKVRHTSLRVAEILNGKRDLARSRSWKPAVSMVTGFAIVCGVWSARLPKLIAFSDSATSQGSQRAGASNLAQIEGVDSGVSRPIPVTAAKFISRPQKHAPARPAVVRTSRSLPKAGTTVHLIASEPVYVPFTQTMFFVVEGHDGGTPNVHVYQIQMFRLTILHLAGPAGSQNPRNET